ncbi:hypothetical protein [Arthrobacter sp.]|uniref:hypothetical protein n=1 Tax=Arthrobacter sp. TaxID=1667 RepID=UPI003A93C9DF
MNLLSSLVVAASSAPAVPTGDAAREIGPGFAGFVATAAMVIVVIFLIRDMSRRIRRVRYAGTAEERQAELVERGRERHAQTEEFPPRGNPGPDGVIGSGSNNAQDDDGEGPDAGHGQDR